MISTQFSTREPPVQDNMGKFTTESTIELFGGKLLKLKHDSTSTKTSMAVNIYLPPQYEAGEKKLPVILYLAGLTCSPDNGAEKSFFTYHAAKNGFGVVFPDTSPRGANIEGEDKDWDFGTAAGFYVDSTAAPWSENYNMYSYVISELLPLVGSEFEKLDVKGNCGITGHSMGGYGAIMFYLRNPGMFKSCSAFAPICNPSIVPWGEKCYSNYLGPNKDEWLKYDPCELVKSYAGNPSNVDEKILIYVGTKDVFDYRDNQLRCQNLVDASKGTVLDGKVDLRVVDDYDHSYYFVSSFSEPVSEFHVNSFSK